MKRNLVMVHMESLSNLLYRMNPSFFSNIKKIEKQSLSFQKYYSTATSTLMVLGDIFYGGMEQYEQCTALDYIPEQYHYSSSLFDDLKKNGYKTGIYIYPEGSDRDSAERRHIAGFYNTMVLEHNYSKYMDSINLLMDEKPFAISACNYISNLALNNYVDLEKEYAGFEKWEKGYQALDESVGEIFKMLEDKNLLDNTTIIFYGDHGDDYWGHGHHKGLTHAIEPYEGLIHTPLFIYDNRIAPGYCNDIVSAEDLKGMIEKLLFTEGDIMEDLYPKRKYAIARTSYAAQPVRYDSFKKAYSITNGKLLLLVSSDGLELYDVEMDPACAYNFLNDFIYDGTILQYSEERCKEKRYHYRGFMNRKQIDYLRQKFYYLRARLYEEVQKLYVAGECSIDEMNSEMEFGRIRYTD